MLTGDIIAGNSRRHPDGTAWTFEGACWSWRQVNDRVNRLANALLSLGLTAQDRVAFLCDNSHCLAELYFALAKAGLVAVPINARSISREIHYVVRDVEPRAFFISSHLEHRLSPDACELIGVPFVVGIGDGHGQGIDYEELLTSASSEEPETAVEPNDTRAIKYTSGTTGAPKGVVSTHYQYTLSTLNYLLHSPFTKDDRCLLALPLTAGVGVQMLVSYAHMACPVWILRRFDPEEVLSAIERHRITRLYVVPTMLAAMNDAQARRPRDLSSIRMIEYAGGPAPLSLVQRAARVLDVPLAQTYGSSEAGGQVAFLPPDQHKRLLLDDGVRRVSESLPFGCEMPGYHIRIVDDAGHAVPDGQVGEMVISSHAVMSGYWRQPSMTSEVLRDGWLYTGDLVRRDEHGWLTMVDRKRDTIASGGFKIYSAEVEMVLSEHPAVREVAVVGEPDEHWGEAIVAFIVLHAGASCGAPDLMQFCRDNLADFKRPKRYRFMESLPKTSSGKVRKVELRKREPLN